MTWVECLIWDRISSLMLQEYSSLQSAAQLKDCLLRQVRWLSWGLRDSAVCIAWRNPGIVSWYLSGRPCLLDDLMPCRSLNTLLHHSQKKTSKTPRYVRYIHKWRWRLWSRVLILHLMKHLHDRLLINDFDELHNNQSIDRIPPSL